MHVVFRRSGHVVIDDMRYRIHVNATSRDVGRDQHARAPIPKSTQCSFALRLRAIGMNPINTMLACFQYMRKTLRSSTRAGKNQHSLKAFAFQQIQQQRDF